MGNERGRQLGPPIIEPELEAKVKAALAKPNHPGVLKIAEQSVLVPGPCRSAAL